MSYLLFVPLLIFFALRLWRDWRWSSAVWEERLGVLLLGAGLGAGLPFIGLPDWRAATWLVLLSASGGWYAREIAGWALATLRHSLAYYLGGLGRYLAPVVLPVVLFSGLALYSTVNLPLAVNLAEALVLLIVLIGVSRALLTPAKKKKKKKK